MRRFILLAVALVALVVVLGGQVSVSAREPDLSRAIAALEAHNPVLLSLPGVAGTGVGLDASGQAVARIFLERPGVAGVPGQINGVRTETVVTGMFVAYCDKTSHCTSPVPIGVSTGHTSITAGTLGAKVRDSSGNVYALSNNHVFANSNNASLGDSILQPGPYDGGTTANDLIGVLHAFEPIKFDGSDNLMDAAIMRPTTRTLSASTPGGEYSLSSAVANATVGLAVKKYGRTTGLTNGSVAEVNVTVNVCYEVTIVFCTKQARFVNQVSISPGSFSAGGDSGSLIVRASDNAAVALLFAGSSTRTIGSPIGPVLTRFGVTIDSSGGAAPTATPTPAATNTPLATSTPVPTATTAPAPTSTPTPAPTSTPVPEQTPVAGTVGVSSIDYSTTGGRNGNNHLRIAATVTNGDGQAVSNASVSIALANGSSVWNMTSSTNSSGVASFSLNNFPNGCYTSTVTAVGANGLSWDGSTPANGPLCK
jgi:hypothetical protein